MVVKQAWVGGLPGASGHCSTASHVCSQSARGEAGLCIRVKAGQPYARQREEHAWAAAVLSSAATEVVALSTWPALAPTAAPSAWTANVGSGAGSVKVRPAARRTARKRGQSWAQHWHRGTVLLTACSDVRDKASTVADGVSVSTAWHDLQRGLLAARERTSSGGAAAGRGPRLRRGRAAHARAGHPLSTGRISAAHLHGGAHLAGAPGHARRGAAQPARDLARGRVHARERRLGCAAHARGRVGRVGEHAGRRADRARQALQHAACCALVLGRAPGTALARTPPPGRVQLGVGVGRRINGIAHISCGRGLACAGPVALARLVRLRLALHLEACGSHRARLTPYP